LRTLGLTYPSHTFKDASLLTLDNSSPAANKYSPVDLLLILEKKKKLIIKEY
jgi:hypothetical protein